MIGWWGGGGARDLSKFRYASLSLEALFQQIRLIKLEVTTKEKK